MTLLRNTRLAVLVAFALCCAQPAAMQAQFSAPAPTSSTSLNVRHPITTDPAILFPADRDIRMLPGDLIRVTVFGATPAYVSLERVSQQGTVLLNLAGVVHVGGLTLQGAESTIADRFSAAGMFMQPQVSVELIEFPNHSITLLGELHGVQPVFGSKRLFDVLSTAGGLPITASSIITIQRPGLADPIIVDVGNDPANSNAGNIPLFAGDTITVGRVGIYYIVGAVKTQGALPLNGITPITIMQAIALAGGANFEAKLDDTRLVRTTGTQRTVLNIHIKQILKGAEPDPVLQADDILLIPSNALKAILRQGGVGTVVAVAVSAASFFR